MSCTVVASSSAQIRTFRQNQRDFEEEMNRRREERREQKLAKQEVNYRDREQTEKYDPFGKSGGGAPNVSDKVI